MGLQATARATERGLTGLLLTVSAGGILAPLNSTMLAVALPQIRDEFEVSHAALGWLVSSYLIAMAVGQPVAGRLGDALGRERVFRWALWAFLLCSLAAVVAPTFWLLILARTAQALAGAAVMPNGLAMLRQAVPPQRAGRLFGLNGAAMSCAAAIGPLLGAALLTSGSWRAIFLANVPVVALALTLLARRPAAPVASRARYVADWLGAALFTLILVATTVLLGNLRGSTAVLLASGVTATAALAVFVRHLRTAAAPTIEWRLFRLRSYAMGTLHVLLTNLVMYTTLLTVPFFIEEVQHGGSGLAGLLLGVMSICMTVAAPLSGWLSDRVGRRTPTLVGSAVLLVGTFSLAATIESSSSPAVLAAALAVIGLGVGTSVASASTAAIEAAPVALAGSASGTNSMMRYLGSIVGAGALGSLLASDLGAPPIEAFRAIFVLTAVFAAACIPIAARLHVHLGPPEPTRR